MPAIPVQLPDLAQNQSGALGILRRLENGAQLQGRVQRPNTAGQTPIQVGQSTLPLVLQEPLPPGTLVTLRSQGGKIVLEPQTAQHSSSTPQRSTGGQVAPLLPESAPALIRALQANQLPAQIETLQAIQTVLGQVAPDQLPILAFLLARNVAITPGLLAEVRDRLRFRGNLGEELGKLAAGIEQLLSSSTALPEELRQLLGQLKGMLYWNPRGTLDERIQSLREFLTGFEAKILAGQGVEGDLKALLLKLQNLFPMANLPADHPLRESVRQILTLLEGAQLSSLPGSTTHSEEEWRFWRIPFPGDPNPTTVELAVRGEKDPENPEQLDPESMEILLQLDLAVLGPIRARLTSTREGLMLRISVDRKESRQILLKEVPDLVVALQENGFKSVSTEVRVEAVKPAGLIDELGPLRRIEKRLKEAPETSRLDIKL